MREGEGREVEGRETDKEALREGRDIEVREEERTTESSPGGRGGSCCWGGEERVLGNSS